MFSMLHLGTHMECGKVGFMAVSFIATVLGATWSQQAEQISNPVDSKRPYTLNTAGVGFQEQDWGG